MRMPFFIAVFTASVLGLFAGIFIHPVAGIVVGVNMAIGFIAFGAAHIRSGFFIRSINRVPQDQKNIVLSFDDGPCIYTPEVLSVLEKHRVKAMFFLIGKNVAGKEDMVRKMHSDGHRVGNHTWSHAKWFDFWSSGRMYKDIVMNNEILEQITGEPVRFFRPPYGVTNPPLAKALIGCRMNVIGWSFRSLDTVKGAGKQMEEKVLSRVKPGDILLFHDTVEGVAGLLDAVIPQLQSKGFKFIVPE